MVCECEQFKNKKQHNNRLLQFQRQKKQSLKQTEDSKQDSERRTFVGHGEQPVRLHLVQNLLPGLGLSHQVRVGTATGDEGLDLCDLRLLLLAQLDL